jgi:hypothetical protein
MKIWIDPNTKCENPDGTEEKPFRDCDEAMKLLDSKKNKTLDDYHRVYEVQEI